MKFLFFNSRGRINRSRFWLGLLLLMLFLFLFLVMRVALLFLYAAVPMGILVLFFEVLALACLLVLVWMSFSLNTKRWHDQGRSGKWNLLALIPLVGFPWMFLELGFIPGTDGPNQYGEKP